MLGQHNILFAITRLNGESDDGAAPKGFLIFEKFITAPGGRAFTVHLSVIFQALPGCHYVEELELEICRSCIFPNIITLFLVFAGLLQFISQLLRGNNEILLNLISKIIPRWKIR